MTSDCSCAVRVLKYSRGTPNQQRMKCLIESMCSVLSEVQLSVQWVYEWMAAHRIELKRAHVGEPRVVRGDGERVWFTKIWILDGENESRNLMVGLDASIGGDDHPIYWFQHRNCGAPQSWFHRVVRLENGT